MITIPADLEAVLGKAWEAAQKVQGYLGENEARFLGMLAACIPAKGALVEIGSFKGRSTVMLAKVASHYGLGPVVAIDPHNSDILLDHRANPAASSFQDFLRSVDSAGLSEHVEIHRAYSSEVAAAWVRPIRFLWIDGDHTYAGAKHDLDSFSRHLAPFGVVAFHDALNAFPGPIRVFVEDILRSDRFGAAGFVQSTAWAQFRPTDGGAFQKRRAMLDRKARRLIPYAQAGYELRGLPKILFKLNRSRVPRSAMGARDLAVLLDGSPA
jgi:predicted O-methyltransferase YrrM